MTLDYQVTPALSEEMAMEFLALRPRPGFFKRFRLPFFLAFCFACLAAGANPKLVKCMTNGREDPIAELVSRVVLGAVFGFYIGWIGVRVRRESIKRRVVARIRTGAAAGLAARTFSWDEAGVGITSPASRHEWKWTAMDAIWDGAVGAHFLWRGELLFNVPKHALPADAQPEKLREMLRRFSPPMLPDKLL